MDTTTLVAEILARSGKSKSVLCSEAGISRSLLDGYLKGRNNPTMGQLSRLADAAGYEISVDLHSTPRPMPETLVHVLEFGDLFPRKQRAPLVNLGPIWEQARNRG